MKPLKNIGIEQVDKSLSKSSSSDNILKKKKFKEDDRPENASPPISSPSENHKIKIDK